MSKISIIVPIYNVEQYIRKCIDSIINQTYPNLEIILIDDGSTDNSSHICDEYAARDERIVVIHKTNGGLSDARNAGLEIATGKYIGFVDGDDYIHPQMYEKLILSLEKAEADISICSYLSVDLDGNKIPLEFQLQSQVLSNIQGMNMLAQKTSVFYIVVWNKLYKRELFENIKFPVGKIHEDQFIMHRVFDLCTRIVTIEDQLYYYVQRNGSIMSEGTTVKSLDCVEAICDRIEFYNQRGYSELEKEALTKLFNLYISIRSNIKYSSAAEHDQIKKTDEMFREFYCSKAGKISIKNNLILKCPKLAILFLKIDRKLKIRKFFLIILKLIDYIYYFIKIFFKYISHLKTKLGFSKDIYFKEFIKYLRCCIARIEIHRLYEQVTEFCKDHITCVRSDAVFTGENFQPTVICVVKDEIDRMQLFYDHYRKLGVSQFAIIDNNSSDGTLDFLLKQSDTHVYSVKEPFKTDKKVSWIEKVLALEGYNKWMIVVDSDELLDYPGSETCRIQNWIEAISKKGVQIPWGMMLDMYSKNELFSVSCDDYKDIPKELCYFDYDSYIFEHTLKGRALDSIKGGPRFRLFGTSQLQNKQAVFYYTDKILYRHCHYLYPSIKLEDAPFCYVLRHYKFLKTDQNAYKNRIEEKSFYNGSIEYIQQMNSIAQGKNYMFYDKSVLYENSYSLLNIPHLTDILNTETSNVEKNGNK